MSEKQLSQEELIQIRELLRSEERTKWFWASLRIWVGWIASVITATVGIVIAIRQLWHS